MERKESSLSLNLQTWDKYWAGGNIKYPGIGLVTDLKIMKQRDKLSLLKNILDERRKICGFDTDKLTYGTGAEAALKTAKVALFIPSGGKKGDWFWQKNKTTGDYEWWWARMAAKGVPVFLVVSDEEVKEYQSACNISIKPKPSLYVVGYNGFGIGRGRCVSARLLCKYKLQGVITDDRTSKVENDKSPVEANLSPLTEYLVKGGSLCSVGPKLNCNILTIIDGSKELEINKKKGIFCFPSVLIASKEDFCLAKMIELNIGEKGGEEKEKFALANDIWQVVVHTDTNNPTYTNNKVEYKNPKKDALEKCIKSAFFVDKDGKLLSADFWRKQYNFQNLWDMIKMQESAIHQLIDSLGEIESDNKELFHGILETHFFAT